MNGKVVVVRVKGELAGGKTTDIDFAELRRNLATRGALYVHFNRFSLTSKEYDANRIAGEDPSVIEGNLFRENIGTVKVSQSNLKGESGRRFCSRTSQCLQDSSRRPENPRAIIRAEFSDSSIKTLKLQNEFEGDSMNDHQETAAREHSESTKSKRSTFLWERHSLRETSVRASPRS